MLEFLQSRRLCVISIQNGSNSRIRGSDSAAREPFRPFQGRGCEQEFCVVAGCDRSRNPRARAEMTRLGRTGCFPSAGPKVLESFMSPGDAMENQIRLLLLVRYSFHLLASDGARSRMGLWR
jgi:hypothetical protein